MTEVELPPQLASATAIPTTAGASHAVVSIPFFIVLTPIRRRFVAVTDRDKHRLFPRTGVSAMGKQLNQHPLYAAVVRACDIISHPVLAEHMPGNLDDDVISVEIGIVVIALQALQAGRA